MAEENKVSRRSFMSTATWLIGGLISLIYAIPAIAYLIAPTLDQEEEEQWLNLGSAAGPKPIGVD